MDYTTTDLVRHTTVLYDERHHDGFTIYFDWASNDLIRVHDRDDRIVIETPVRGRWIGIRLIDTEETNLDDAAAYLRTALTAAVQVRAEGLAR